MIIDPETYLYEKGTGLEVPGIEAVLEYGDASAYAHGGIPGALRINDRSKPDQVHVTELTGLHDDPDIGDSRTERAVRWGERTGLLVPRGRTVGVTGQVRSGNVYRMRDLWRRMRAQFGRVERDLIIHPPNEAPFYVNEVTSMAPLSWGASVISPGTGAVSATTAFTDGFITGVEAPFTGVSAAAQIFMASSPFAWSGEDIWLYAIVKVQAAAATASSIMLGVALQDGFRMATGTGMVSSPVTGTYYVLSFRMLAKDLMTAGASAVPMAIMTAPSTSGNYTMRIARFAAVNLAPDVPSPSGYVHASLSNFEWEGAPDESRSYGPCYAVNQVSDPDSNTSIWANDSTSGATVVTAGAVVRAWPTYQQVANSWSLSNPNTTSRTLAVRYPVTLSDPNLFVVAGGRSYRTHVRLRVQQSYSSGVLQVVWLNASGTTISTSLAGTFDPVALGGAELDVEVSGVVVAPALAVRAYMRIAASTPSTATNDRLILLIAEPRFVDVSEYDAGDVAMDATQPSETGVDLFAPVISAPSVALAPKGSRRRIPRPFQLRGVRSLWDGKAPESQRNLQHRRDFTMSLRASDPRIYVFDERHAQVKATGTPKRVSYGNFNSPFPVPGDYPMFTKPPPVPVGFTYEGQSFDADVEWLGTILGSYNPRYAPSLGPSETAPPASGYLAANSLARMYRSLEAYTYTTPEVMVTGDCISGQGFDYDLFADSLIGGDWQYNYIGPIIKRVSSGTWLELRYNSANNAAMTAAHGSPAAPYSLELWCSHDASGTSSTTRLGAWDVPTSDIVSGVLKRVRAFIDSTGVVWCELWNKDPNFNDDGLLLRQSYTLPGPLSTLLGPAVAGQAGQMARLAQWDDGTHIGISVDQQAINYGFPYLAAYDAIDYNASLIYLNCPVIGDADDVPWTLQLRGDIVDPAITLVGGERTATLKLSGTFPESDPVTIDFDAGTIISAAGNDYFARRLVGSRFFNLAPGQNLIIIQASGWNAGSSVHAIASWRDALH